MQLLQAKVFNFLLKNNCHILISLLFCAQKQPPQCNYNITSQVVDDSDFPPKANFTCVLRLPRYI